MNELNQALLAAVPADGSSIGNQSLLERLRGQFPQLTEEAFWEARDANDCKRQDSKSTEHIFTLLGLKMANSQSSTPVSIALAAPVTGGSNGACS